MLTQIGNDGGIVTDLIVERYYDNVKVGDVGIRPSYALPEATILV